MPKQLWLFVLKVSLILEEYYFVNQNKRFPFVLMFTEKATNKTHEYGKKT